MKKLFELEDITLWPKNGVNVLSRGVVDYLISGDNNNNYLPIFTAPMSSVVDSSNYSIWESYNIRSILPRTDPIINRIEASKCGIFSAFGIEEVIDNFISNRQIFPNKLFICIDSGIGHDHRVIELGSQLRKIYQSNICIMGGNISNWESYLDYCKADFDYVRVGLFNGSSVDRNRFGFHYPMASLLEEIRLARLNLKPYPKTKIIADGGIGSQSDIMKALAIGADYVMLGRQFAALFEAAGPLFEKNSKGRLIKADMSDTSKRSLFRKYSGNSFISEQAKRCGLDIQQFIKQGNIKLSDCKSNWVIVDSNLTEWIQELKKVVDYSFYTTSSSNWIDFKNNVNYGSISR